MKVMKFDEEQSNILNNTVNDSMQSNNAKSNVSEVPSGVSIESASYIENNNFENIDENVRTKIKNDEENINYFPRKIVLRLI